MSADTDDWLIDSGVDQLNVVIGRTQVETGDVSEILTVLQSLLTSTERVCRFANRVCLFVDGYNDDPRELYEVPEVRSFLQALDRQFPYWLWFLDRRTFSLTLVAAGCTDLRSFRGTEAVAYLSTPALGQFLSSHFSHSTTLPNSSSSIMHLSPPWLTELQHTLARHFRHLNKASDDSRAPLTTKVASTPWTVL